MTLNLSTMNKIIVLMVVNLSLIASTPITLQQNTGYIHIQPNSTYQIQLSNPSSSIQHFTSSFQQTPATITIGVKCTKEAMLNIYYDSNKNPGYSRLPSPTNGFSKAATLSPQQAQEATLQTQVQEGEMGFISLYYTDNDGMCSIDFTTIPRDSYIGNKPITKTAIIVIATSVSALLLIVIIINCRAIRKNLRTLGRYIVGSKRNKRKNSSQSQNSNSDQAQNSNSSGENQGQRVERAQARNGEAANTPSDEVSDDEEHQVQPPYQVINIRVEAIIAGRETRAPDENELSSMSISVPEERSVDIPEDFLCIICLNAKKQIAFMPCKHVCACQYCSLKILEVQSKCPLCRKEIDSIQPAFTPQYTPQ